MVDFYFRGIKMLLAFLIAIPLMLPMNPSVSFADDPICVFVAQKGSAWVVRKDSSVKMSLNIGDVLYPGDEVLVLRGNSVQLAFDKDVQNVIQIEGESMLKLTGGKPFNVELYRGKVFAVINKKDIGTQFSITTPTAVAAVRGTQYQVTYKDEKTNVYTYQGVVRVSGRKDGKETSDFVVVKAGEKTLVKEAGKPPEPPKKMTVNELTEIKPVLQKAEENASLYRGEVAEKFAPPPVPSPESAKPSGNKSQSIPSTPKKDTTEDTKGNRIII